jgi:hypothetical protein
MQISGYNHTSVKKVSGQQIQNRRLPVEFKQDELILGKNYKEQPLSFEGLGYYVRSSKGRQDLKEYLKAKATGLTSYNSPGEVNLPDLKSDQKLERIILHWSASNTISPGSIARYHYAIDNAQDNKIYEGIYSIADNARQIDDNNYAAHVHQGNSYSAGISLIGMKDATAEGLAKNSVPITEDQLDKACALIARMLKKYKLPLNEHTVTTHYEFGLQKGDINKEKIDIRYFPWDMNIPPEEVGNKIRAKVKEHLEASYPQAA